MTRLEFMLVVSASTLLLASCSGARRAENSAAQSELHLYLLAGQSNMAGRGEVEEIDRTPLPNVFALNSAMEWVPATEPLHFDKPDIVGVGPGFAFGRAMAAADPRVRIGLIPGAVGGSSIRVWRPGETHTPTNTHPWDDAILRTKHVLVEQGGVLKGIIWHQGESDSKDDSAPHYGDALVDLVERFRNELGDSELPFVACPLSDFFAEIKPAALEVNAAIEALPQRVPNTAVVSADGLTPKDDNVHLDSASARELGRRYAEAMLKLQRE